METQDFWARYRQIILAGGILILLLLIWFLVNPLGSSPSTFSVTEITKVQADDDLVLSFDQAMDQKSVEENLVIPDGVTGEISWKENNLVFNPSSELAPAQKYQFTVLKNAQTVAKKPLEQNIDFNFFVAGVPTLVSRIPAIDGTEVPTDSRITLVFDQPMIPLTQVQGAAADQRLADWPVTISPSIPGRWRWLGTTSVVYEASEALQAATRYTVNVPSGINSANDDQTAETFTWSFETIRPQALSIRSADESWRYGPNTPILLEFNMPIDLNSVKEHLSLQHLLEANSEDPQTESIALKPLRYHQEKIDGENITRENIVVLEPRQALEFNQSYQVYLSTGVRSTAGELGSLMDFSSQFESVGDLEVTFAEYSYYRIAFDFSNPIDGETLKNNISISPDPISWDEKNKELPEWSDGVYVSFQPQLKARTTYTFTFKTGLTDIFGQKLKEPFSYEFTTNPLPSRVFIHSEGEFGLFEKDKPPVYFLNGINVSKMQVDFAPLSLNDLLNIRAQKNNDYDYEPDLSSFEGHQLLTLDPPTKALDEWGVREFNVEQEFGKLQSGIYALTLQAPEYHREYDDQGPYIEQQYFALTNMALTLKYSGNKALVWLVDTQTGAPIADANIAFHALNGDVPLRGRTDSQGFLEADLPLADFATEYNEYNPEFYVTAEKDGDLTFVGSQWNEGLRPYNFGLNEDFLSPQSAEYQVESYVYTERPLYKAGDTVHFKGVTRLRERSTGQLFPPAKSRKAIVTIEDARYQEVYNETLAINEFGSFSGSFTIAEDASLGNYYLGLQVTPENDITGNYGGTNFSVLAYRKPEYQVEPIALADDYYNDDTLKFEIQGSYYFGAPLDNARIEWRARSTDFFFNRYTDGYYSFSLEDSWCWWNCERETSLISEGSGNLDAQGHYSVEFPYNIDDKSLSQIVTLEADVFDPNNQVVSNRVSVPVHKAAVYVGIRPKDYVVSPGEKASVEVVTVNPDGTPKPNQRVVVKMYAREWNSIRKQGVDGEFYYDNEPEDTYLRETVVTTNEEGKAIAEIVVEEGGQHRMLAEVSDNQGRQAKADTSVYVYSSTFVNWPRANHDRIEVVADKPEYKVGDIAKLLVKSPFQGENVKALVTVEREQIMSREVINVESNAQPIEIEITEDMIPNAYVSVVIIKPREGETFNENGLDTGVPAFRIGYSKLLVETSRKELNLEISTNNQKYAPREAVSVELKTTDWQGNPVSAEVSLGVVDMSLLALTGFQMPDLVGRFYSERGLGINTAQTLLYLLERFKPGSKGGGGADGDSETRGNFKDTAYWNPSIITDENGKAQVSFDLPDNLTTWQLLGIANTKQHTFGAITHEIIETKDVIVRSVRPRFAVAGDEIELGAIVHNFLDEPQSFTVELNGLGFTGMGDMTQTVRLEPGTQSKLNFPVQMEYVDSATFTFSARSDGGSDAVEESIPVYVFGTPQSVATSGQTEDIVQERVLVPTEKDAKEGSLSVTLSPTLASFLPAGLEYVVNYPFGCAEQVMSSFLPSVALRGLQGFEAFKIVDDEQLREVVSVGLQKLYNFQRADGGFGYWQGSTRSYAYLSSYILFGMFKAREFGFSVDDNAIYRVRQYLDSALRVQDLQDPIDLATRAYILFVLSETGNVDASLVNNLADQQDKLPVFAKAMLAMTLQDVGTGASKNKAQALLEDILETTKVDARGTHFEEKDRFFYRGLMSTNTRTTALVLQTLVRLQPDHPLIPRVVRYLLAVREQGHWDTTQSTSMTILAFMEFLNSTGELDGDFRASVSIDDEQVLQQQFNADNILTQETATKLLDELNRGQQNLVKIGKEGVGRLYYDMVMEYFYTADQIPPAEEGLGILREFEPVKVAQKDQVTVGDTYKVTLTMTVPQDRHFVAVESPLPAGLELIDLRLQTSQQDEYGGTLNEPEEGQWWNNLWYFNHTEFRDDRVVLFSDYLPTGVYEYEFLVRATTPGKFHHRPARIYEMYFPETFGQTSGEWFEVKGDE